MKKIILLITVFFTVNESFSQVEWLKMINRTENEMGSSVQQTNFGGYVVGGSAGGFMDNYFLMAVTDENGDTIITKLFSDIGNHGEIPVSVIQTNDNSYVLGSTFNTFGQDVHRFCLYKTDENGNILWSEIYSNNGVSCFCSKSMQTSDNGFILVGGDMNYKPFFVKTDTDGNLEWNKSVTQIEDAYALDIIEVGSDYYICGYSNLYFNPDFFILKLNNLQEVEWIKTFPNSYPNYPLLDLIYTSDNNLLLSGCSYNQPNNGMDAFLLKTDMDGNEIWTKTYSNSQYSFFSGSVETANGNYISAGGFADCTDGREKVYLVETDTNGEFVKEQLVTQEGYNMAAYDLSKNSDGSYIITGYIESSSSEEDFLLLKIGADGIIADIVNPEIKYGVSVYPNPSKDYVIVELPHIKENVKVSICDLSGKEVWSKEYGAGSKDLELDVSGLKSGVYFIKTEYEGYSATEKIVIN